MLERLRPARGGGARSGSSRCCSALARSRSRSATARSASGQWQRILLVGVRARCSDEWMLTVVALARRGLTVRKLRGMRRLWREMRQARRHQRLSRGLALGLLALVAELTGRSLTHRLDFGRHVETPSYSGADYYPVLLAVVKVAVALMLARLAWRFVRARTVARGARRLLAAPMDRRSRAACHASASSSPPRLWLGSFVVDLADLSRADGRRGNLRRPLAAAGAVAAYGRAAGLRRPVRRRRARVSRRRASGSPITRATRARRPRVRHVAWRPACAAPRQAVADLVTPRSLFGLAFEAGLLPRLRKPACRRPRAVS